MAKDAFKGEFKPVKTMANTTADKIFVGELGKSTKKIYDALDKVGVQTLKDVQKVGKHNAGSALLGNVVEYGLSTVMSFFSLPGTFAYEATFGAISRDLQRPEKIKLMYEASYTTMKVIERKFNAGLKVTQYELDLFRKAARTKEQLHYQYNEIRRKEQEEARKKKEEERKKNEDKK